MTVKTKETPCEELNPITNQHECAYKDTYTGFEDEMCRICCGLGVDEDAPESEVQ